MLRADFSLRMAAASASLLLLSSAGCVAIDEDPGDDIVESAFRSPNLEDQPPLSLTGCGDGVSTAGSFCFTRVGLAARGSLALGEDFDGDGHLDLAVVEVSSAVVRILFGAGDGNFDEQAVVLDLPAAPFRAPYLDPQIFAFDSSAAAGKSIGLLFSGSTELWVVNHEEGRSFEVEALPILHLGSSAPLVMDIDGDQDDDVLLGAGLGSTESYIEVLRRVDGGGHVYAAVSAPAQWAMVTSLADLGDLPSPLGAGVPNAEFRPRVLAAGTWEGIRAETPILGYGVKDGELEPAGTVFMAGADPYWLLSGDVDADGLADALVGNRASADFTLARRESSGGFTAASRLPVADLPLCVAHGCESMLAAAVGDFDGDGRAEPLAEMSRENGRSHLYVIDHVGQGLVWVGYDAHRPVVGDFNEDEVDDLVFAHPEGNYILLSTP